MAEKEERIVCRVIEKGYGCDYCFSRPAHNYYQCSISNNDCTYDMCKQCSLGMTRQEAIERMAKANWIATVCAKNQCVPVDITKEQWDEEWEKLRIDYKKVYYAGAEAALNALLEKGE